MERAAIFSDCRKYRYKLTRIWDPSLPLMMFIGLNPSVANENEDDHTIRKCIGFTSRQDCGGFIMTNLFAFVSTDPRGLKAAEDPIGPQNDLHLINCANDSKIVIAAWGMHGGYKDRATAVQKLMLDANFRLHCYGRTVQGFPRHPLMLKYKTALVPL